MQFFLYIYAIGITIQGVIIVVLYRLMYLNNIRKLREILEEIEIFENNE